MCRCGGGSVCVLCVHVREYAMAWIWRSADNLLELVLSCQHVGSGNQTLSDLSTSTFTYGAISTTRNILNLGHNVGLIDL